MNCINRIALAAIIVISLITLSSTFVPEHYYLSKSPGNAMQGHLSKRPLSPNAPATSNEPASQISSPTLSFMRPVPVTIKLGKVSDLSFIYEGRKLAYVQFYSTDYDRVMRIPYEDYRKLASTGRITSYDLFTPGDHNQSVHEAGHRNEMQGMASGLKKIVTSIRTIIDMLRDYTQGFINMIRTAVT